MSEIQAEGLSIPAQNPSPESTTQDDRGQLKWNEQRAGEAAPSTEEGQTYAGVDEGSAWLGGPQNGDETSGQSDYTKHRFNETPSEAYGSGSSSGFLPENAKNPKDGSDWLGGPQNGSETPDEAYFIPRHRNETPGEANYQAQSHSVEQQQASGRMGTGNIASTDWLGGPQNGDEIPGNGGNGQVSSDESASTKNDETWTGRGKA